ncbi:CAP domain-containing protein [Planktothrix sp. FACHB-1365]|uniref:CAP domain-containing protein n=1 Tax=Planktothrix sp. FACHB-1365 TaxID=2692855 RepID=UPI001F548CA2|nr:CAP domain-containing protein [Planktothrix sp. FACHB-1365]
MFEVNPSPTSANAITSLAETNAFLAEQVMPKVYQQLQLFASDPTFVEQLKLPFGDTWDIQKAQTLATEWLTGDFSTLAPIKIVASADINGSSGAFADTTNQIYLAEDILTGSNVNQAVSVVLEEIGHSLDPRLNSSDSIGDEGEIFANIVQGKVLSPEQIQTLKAENDHATITIDGNILSVEFNDVYDYYSQNWGGEIFDWTTGQNESKGWYPFTRNDQNAVSTRDSISRNWGNSSPSDVGSDYFGVNLWTIADFEAGNTYNFSVTADDFYRVGVIPLNAYDSNQWVNISGQDWNWLNDAYNGKQYTFTPTISGEYWVYAGYAEKQDTASFNISWTTNNNGGGTTNNDANSFEQRVFELTNQERLNAGLLPLTYNYQLEAAAETHSQNMALQDFYAHNGVDGTTPWDRITATGYNFSWAAENIYASPTTPEAAVEGWMNSPLHRANILDPNLTEIGVGYYYLANDTGNVNWNHYWTQNFGTPA